MEASERPQLPLDEIADPDGSVRAIDDRLVIERLTVADAGSARVVREQAAEGRAPARDRDARRSRSEPACSTARRPPPTSTTCVASSARGSASSTASSATRSRKGPRRSTERIAIAFGAERNDSVQAQIKEIVTAESRQQREQLLSALTAEDASNPLNAMQIRIGKKIVETEERHRAEVEKLRESHTTQSRAMQGQVSELKEHLARLLDKGEHELELAEAEAAGTRKGFTFEERVHDAIEAIAAVPRRSRLSHRQRAGRGWRQEGRHPGRDRRLRRRRPGPDRLRGQGQPALEEQGMGAAQRLHGGARGLVRGARGRGRRERPGRSRAAKRVRGQQDDRRRRSG